MGIYSDPWVVERECKGFKVVPEHTYAGYDGPENHFLWMIDAQELANQLNEIHRRRHPEHCKRMWGERSVLR